MTLMEAIESRHSVRRYTYKAIEAEKIETLNEAIEKINTESGFHIQLVVNEPKAFNGIMAHYGNFSGVTNYFAIVGPKGRDEDAGYCGEKLVLLAQQLGLNTCWVAATFSKIKDAYKVESGEKLYVVISLGYGETQGIQHKSKAMETVAKGLNGAPDWYINGVKAALLAPTAVNQQKFSFELLEGSRVKAKASINPLAKLDLGIVKYHFEIGAGTENFRWI